MPSLTCQIMNIEITIGRKHGHLQVMGDSHNDRTGIVDALVVLNLHVLQHHHEGVHIEQAIDHIVPGGLGHRRVRVGVGLLRPLQPVHLPFELQLLLLVRRVEGAIHDDQRLDAMGEKGFEETANVGGVAGVVTAVEEVISRGGLEVIVELVREVQTVDDLGGWVEEKVEKMSDLVKKEKKMEKEIEMERE